MFFTRLQLDHVSLSASLEFLLIIEALFGTLVKGLQVGDVGLLIDKVREVVVELSNQHTELGAPVAHVIHTVHLVSKELENPADTVTLNSRAQMANVHVLSDVGRRKID